MTALLLAAIGRVRPAIMALAALILLRWVDDLPTIPVHGLEFSLTGPGMVIIFERLAAPVLAVAAIMFALRNTRLVLATLFVTLTMLVSALGIAMYVMVHGF